MQNDQKPMREIKYHIGWKQGTIQVDDKGKPLIPTHHREDSKDEAFHPKWIRYLWKEAPTPPLSVWVMLLCAAPIVVASASLWLVLILSKHGS